MKEPLRRLASAFFEHTIRHPSGQVEEVTGWHFVDKYHWWQRKGHVQGWALISEDVARLLGRRQRHAPAPAHLELAPPG